MKSKREPPTEEPVVEISATCFNLTDDRGDTVLGVREHDDGRLTEIRMSEVGARMLRDRLSAHLRRRGSTGR